MRTLIAMLIGVLGLALLPGCGGGSNGSTSNGSVSSTGNRQTVPITLSIIWGARSRVINSPNSALSGVLTLQGANPSGGDFTYAFDRTDPTLASYTQTYTTPSTALVGTWAATITFYANLSGHGSVVGSARKQITITASSANIGDIATTGTVASITAPDPQNFEIGHPADLMFTALDSAGHVVAVTPGSALWTINPGNNYSGGQVDYSGHVVPQHAEDLTAKVAMDGKASTMIHIHILDATKYTVTHLGVLPGDQDSEPNGLNAQGDVTGVSVPRGDFHFHAFLWKSNSGLQSLGALPGDTDSTGFGINASDQVVGVSANQPVWAHKDHWYPNTDTEHAFLWSPEKGIQSLPMTAAFSINDAGQVVGQANRHAALWTSEGGVTDLGVLPGYSISAAVAINNAGQVLCQTYDANGNLGATFLWTQAGGSQVIPGGSATALGSNGVVVGVTTPTPVNAPWFTWTPGGSVTSIPMGSMANGKAGNIILNPTGISASGQIVTTMTGDDGLLVTNGTWHYLDDLTNIHVYGVQGINDNGQIIALNDDKAILLTPK